MRKAMMRAVTLAAVMAAGVLSAAVWKDVAGNAFEAEVKKADDIGVEFVLPEGKGVRFRWNQLSQESAAAIREAEGLPEIPPEVASVYRQALRDMRQAKIRRDPENPEAYAERVRGIERAFNLMCRSKKCETADKLWARLCREAAKTAK